MTGRPKGSKAPVTLWTEAERVFIKYEYQDHPIPELTRMLNKRFGAQRTEGSVKAALSRFGFKSGRDGRFKKGNRPSPKAGAKGPNRTSFKKGRKPHTWRPIGTERITKEGYLQRKVSDTGNTVRDYVEVHRLLWEEHHGPIPGGHVVIFKDGDRTNIVIENLMLVSRADHAVMCKMGFYNGAAETKDAALLLVQIIRKRKERR